MDNASGDGTAEMVAVKFPEVRLITLAENIGVAGDNHGFAIAAGEFV